MKCAMCEEDAEYRCLQIGAYMPIFVCKKHKEELEKKGYSYRKNEGKWKR